MSRCVIRYDPTNGNDTNSSGAGPGDGINAGTAISNVSGISAADGLSVILPNGTVLTEVQACIGTANPPVLYFIDTTAGNRNFSEITGTSGSGGATPTVTLAAALGTVLTKNCSIGGLRLSQNTASSRKIWINNGSVGDGTTVGWITEYVDGAVDTITTTTLQQFGVGSTSVGRFELRTVAGYTTRATINTTTNNLTTITPPASAYFRCKGIKFTSSAATRTSSTGIFATSGGLVEVDDCVFGDVTNTLAYGIGGFGIQCLVTNCEFKYCTVAGTQQTRQGATYINNTYHHNAIGMSFSGALADTTDILDGNIFYSNTSEDINIAISGTSSGANIAFYLVNNTFDTCTLDNIKITSTSAQFAGYRGMVIQNNIFSNGASGKYAVNFSGSGITLLLLQAENVKLNGNTYYAGSGAGITNITGLDTNTDTTNPSYTAASTLDFSVGTGLKGKRRPTGYIGNSTTLSYGEPGAAQRLEATSSTIILNQTRNTFITEE